MSGGGSNPSAFSCAWAFCAGEYNHVKRWASCARRHPLGSWALGALCRVRPSERGPGNIGNS